MNCLDRVLVSMESERLISYSDRFDVEEPLSWIESLNILVGSILQLPGLVIFSLNSSLFPSLLRVNDVLSRKLTRDRFASLGTSLIKKDIQILSQVILYIVYK